MTKTTEGGKTDVADVGRLDWDHVYNHFVKSCAVSSFKDALKNRSTRRRTSTSQRRNEKAVKRLAQEEEHRHQTKSKKE
jgi:hypothetical protein